MTRPPRPSRSSSPWAPSASARRPVPTAYGTTGIVTRADNTAIGKPEDLDGKVVGAPQATKYLDAMKALSEEFKKKGGKGLTEIKEYASGYTEIYADIDNGRIDAAP